MGQYYYSSRHKAFVKTCPKCATTYIGKETQEESEKELSTYFASDKRPADGFYGLCRSCVKKANQSNRKGRVCDPEKMLQDQKGLCGICSREITLEKSFGSKTSAYVDHDHITGKVRELLCHRCNSLLGVVENKEWLNKALAYLEKHNANN